MKYITIILLLLTASCTSNQSQKSKADTTTTKSTGIQYTCPMHPKYSSNKPGTCPKCGMELVEKDNSK